MRSTGDVSAADRVRDAAISLFGERGVGAVTIREIAAKAKVSPALVIHHFGSKDQLKDTVDAYVAGFFGSLLDELGRVEDGRANASLAELFATSLEQRPDLLGYVQRLLLDDGSAGDALFDRLFESTHSAMQRLTDAGVVRAAEDDQTRAAFLLVNDLAAVLLRRHIERVIAVDPFSGIGMRQWTSVVMDVYTNGIFKSAQLMPSPHDGDEAEET